MTYTSLALDAPVLMAALPGEVVSFALLLVLALIIAVTAFSLISAVIDFALYAGGAALIIGAIFYFSDTLSFSAGWEYVSELLALTIVVV